MTGHEAVAVRQEEGWKRWSVWCPTCKTSTAADSKENAEDRARQHNQQENALTGDVLVKVREIASELRCECWYEVHGEFDPSGLCPRCRLLELCGAKARADADDEAACIRIEYESTPAEDAGDEAAWGEW
jgi:hypothetical protein